MAAKKEETKAKGKAVKEEVKKGKAVKEEAPAKAKKAAKEEAPAKAKGKAVKEEAPAKEKKAAKGKAEKTAPRVRGRVAGVRNEVTKKDVDLIKTQFTALEQEFVDLAKNVGKLVEGNKAAAGKARKNVQTITKMGKNFRKALQDAKINMKQVKI